MLRGFSRCNARQVSHTRPLLKQEWVEEGPKRKSWFGKTPDPSRPRVEDPGQNIGRSYQQFREEKRQFLMSGDHKRKIPMKALVPEEYRGARYYTDVHMEVVEKRNAMPKVFRGPYSLVTPHRDGRMEHPGDRVPCPKSIRDSVEKGAPLLLPEGFEDSSRYKSSTKYLHLLEIPAARRQNLRARWLFFMISLGFAQITYRYIYCPMHDIPDPMRTLSGRLMVMVPLGVALWMVLGIGGILANKIVLLRYRLAGLLKKK